MAEERKAGSVSSMMKFRYWLAGLCWFGYECMLEWLPWGEGGWWADDIVRGIWLVEELRGGVLERLLSMIWRGVDEFHAPSVSS